MKRRKKPTEHEVAAAALRDLASLLGAETQSRQAPELSPEQASSSLHEWADRFADQPCEQKLGGPFLTRLIAEQYDLFVAAHENCTGDQERCLAVEKARWANCGIDQNSLVRACRAYADYAITYAYSGATVEAVVACVAAEFFMYGVLAGREVEA